METILDNLSTTQMGIIILFTQIIFLWLRTLNIKYISRNHIFGAIMTGNGIALTWMVGVLAIEQKSFFLIIMHLLGGSIGTYLGMRKKVSKLEDNESK